MYPGDEASGSYPDDTQFYLSSPTDTASSGYSEFVPGTPCASNSIPSSRTSASSFGSAMGSCSQPFMDPSNYQIPQAPTMRARPPPHAPHRYVALSTQYVYAETHRMSMLARVAITDYRGNVLYDTFVRPTHQVTDCRPLITGLQMEHLFLPSASEIAIVREHVSAITRGKIIIGHSLWIHLSLLGMCHPAIDTRDVALFLPFHRTLRSFTVTPLKTLVSHLMRRKIGQTYEHPLEDARAALDLFRSYEDPWEDEIRTGGWPCALPPSSFSRCFS